MLDFLGLLLTRHNSNSNSNSKSTGTGGEVRWERGIHLLACSMSGLVAARMAAALPDAFESIMITSPILEIESRFMIESFQGIKELLEEAWRSVHTQTQTQTLRGRSFEPFESHELKLPGEVVQGFTFRWAGEESIPKHISDYLARNWLERLVLDRRGLEAARDWWFDLYWLRSPMPAGELARIKCDILIVEGDRDLPYDREVASELAGLFVNAARNKVVKVVNAPFLLSIKRPERLTQVLLDFLTPTQPESEPRTQGRVEHTPTQQKQTLLNSHATREKVQALEPAERAELVSVYAPHAFPDQEDADPSDDGESEEEDSLVSARFHSVADTTKLGRFGAGGFSTTTTTPTAMSAGAGAGAEGERFGNEKKAGGGEAGGLIRRMQETRL